MVRNMRSAYIVVTNIRLALLILEPASLREELDDVSWVVSTPRSPVTASLHLLALQLKPSLCGLRAPEHPFFTPFIFGLNPGDALGTQGVGV